MPNFHPQLVATVAPFLEPGEEVWAVYPSRRRSLVATGRRLFLIGRDGTTAYPLHEFATMRRPRPSLVLLQWRAGGAIRIALDPMDEHGIQALTVIGLLVASMARPNGSMPDEPAPARSAPSPRPRLAAHRYVPAHRYLMRRGLTLATGGNRGWSPKGASTDLPPIGHGAIGATRHCYRLGLTQLRPDGERID